MSEFSEFYLRSPSLRRNELLEIFSFSSVLQLHYVYNATSHPVPNQMSPAHRGFSPAFSLECPHPITLYYITYIFPEQHSSQGVSAVICLLNALSY